MSPDLSLFATHSDLIGLGSTHKNILLIPYIPGDTQIELSLLPTIMASSSSNLVSAQRKERVVAVCGTVLPTGELAMTE